MFKMSFGHSSSWGFYRPFPSFHWLLPSLMASLSLFFIFPIKIVFIYLKKNYLFLAVWVFIAVQAFL